VPLTQRTFGCARGRVRALSGAPLPG